jgi:hypothetical protein
VICRDCNGSGVVARPAFTLDGIRYPAMYVECDTCQGHGGLCDDCGCAAEYCECIVPMDEPLTPTTDTDTERDGYE